MLFPPVFPPNTHFYPMFGEHPHQFPTFAFIGSDKTDLPAKRSAGCFVNRSRPVCVRVVRVLDIDGSLASERRELCHTKRFRCKKNVIFGKRLQEMFRLVVRPCHIIGRIANDPASWLRLSDSPERLASDRQSL